MKPCYDPEKRALSGAIIANQADPLAPLNHNTYVI